MATSARLSAIDLNLLVVFDAVMQERNVTRAGRRLSLSQPAMSHALTRLRYMLKDDLFIRSPRGMLPTPRAEQLALPVRADVDSSGETRVNRKCPAYFETGATQITKRAIAILAFGVFAAPAAVAYAQTTHPQAG